jgi:hypothetical protein
LAAVAMYKRRAQASNRTPHQLSEGRRVVEHGHGIDVNTDAAPQHILRHVGTTALGAGDGGGSRC